MKILFLAADPSDAVRLRLGQELRDIRERLQLARYRDKFSLDSRESVRIGDITQAIFDTEPRIIHFSGHGTANGELCFEDSSGNTRSVKPDALASLFKLVADQVECVVLNACYSRKQAQQIAKYIPFVIGMDQAIEDKAAIAFSVGFYKALGAGRSVKEAYEFACVEIQLANIPESLSPVLLEKEKVSKEIADQKSTHYHNTTSFFSDRFARAFPGVRSIQTFDSPSEAIVRLSRLLESPLSIKMNDKEAQPIWWFRGNGELAITDFEYLDNDTVLINEKELKIKRVIAANSRSYHQCFVYLEACALEPVGIYNRDEQQQEQIDRMGYSYEVYGLYQRKSLVTAGQHDDCAAFIDGKLVDFEPGTCELRRRYLSSYNMLIAAHESPINNHSFDSILKSTMDNILKGDADVEDLNQAILQLPKRSFYR